MIAIIDYGLGNTQAFMNIYKRLNVPASLASTPAELSAADRIILPGVGSFDWAMQSLRRAGLRDTLEELVLGQKKPVLGVCVGMQMMAKSSEEGQEAGLGWIDARVRRFSFEGGSQNLMLPHMGWNDLQPARRSPILAGLEEGARFYFLHSYYCEAAVAGDVLATADYGGPFACGVQSGNCYGIQCHPEKSHGWGIQLLKNFAEMVPC